MVQPAPIDRESALFLDFDGTLVDIAPTPEAVRVDDGLTEVLGLLAAQLHGALALVSGRPIAQLDRLLGPLHLPAAGIHGAERRRVDGRIERLEAPSLDRVAAAAEQLAAREPRLRIELKGAAVALHYRAAPAFEAACIDAMTHAAEMSGGLHVMRGKMVVEVLANGAGKGRAIEAFLREPPFAGRAPVFAGDDITDEAGFAVVHAEDGRSIKVGRGETLARERIESPAALRRWLHACSEALRGMPRES